MQHMYELWTAAQASAQTKAATASNSAERLKDRVKELQGHLEDNIKQMQALQGRIEELQQALQGQEQHNVQLATAMQAKDTKMDAAISASEKARAEAAEARAEAAAARDASSRTYLVEAEMRRIMNKNADLQDINEMLRVTADRERQRAERKNASGAEAARGGPGRNMDDPSSLRGLVSRLQEAVSVRDEKLAEAAAELAKAAAAAKAAQEAAKAPANAAKRIQNLTHQLKLAKEENVTLAQQHASELSVKTQALERQEKKYSQLKLNKDKEVEAMSVRLKAALAGQSAADRRREEERTAKAVVPSLEDLQAQEIVKKVVMYTAEKLLKADHGSGAVRAALLSVLPPARQEELAVLASGGFGGAEGARDGDGGARDAAPGVGCANAALLDAFGDEVAGGAAGVAAAASPKKLRRP